MDTAGLLHPLALPPTSNGPYTTDGSSDEGEDAACDEEGSGAQPEGMEAADESPSAEAAGAAAAAAVAAGMSSSSSNGKISSSSGSGDSRHTVLQSMGSSAAAVAGAGEVAADESSPSAAAAAAGAGDTAADESSPSAAAGAVGAGEVAADESSPSAAAAAVGVGKVAADESSPSAAAAGAGEVGADESLLSSSSAAAVGAGEVAADESSAAAAAGDEAAVTVMSRDDPSCRLWFATWHAICGVWSSKWNDRAWLSRRALGVQEQELAVSVLLQQVRTDNVFSSNVSVLVPNKSALLLLLGAGSQCAAAAGEGR